MIYERKSRRTTSFLWHLFALHYPFLLLPWANNAIFSTLERGSRLSPRSSDLTTLIPINSGWFFGGKLHVYTKTTVKEEWRGSCQNVRFVLEKKLICGSRCGFGMFRDGECRKLARYLAERANMGQKPSILVTGCARYSGFWTLIVSHAQACPDIWTTSSWRILRPKEFSSCGILLVPITKIGVYALLAKEIHTLLQNERMHSKTETFSRNKLINKTENFDFCAKVRSVFWFVFAGHARTQICVRQRDAIPNDHFIDSSDLIDTPATICTCGAVKNKLIAHAR